MMKEEDRFEIIFRSLHNACTEEELLELEQWLNLSDKNRQRYEEIKDIATTGGFLKGIDVIDKEKALKLVLKRVKKRSSYRSFVPRYAAVIALPLLLGALVYYYYIGHVPEQERVVAVWGNGDPGEARAILYLSDGRVVDLENAEDSVFTDGVTGHRITVDRQVNALNYDEIAGEADSSGQLLYNKIVVPRGSEYMLIMSDGTKVWINSETVLEFPLVFGTDVRRVRLKGEAYFEVVKDLSRRFYVEMGNATIEVTGTSFNASCYPEDRNCSAVLEVGAINFLVNDEVTKVAVGERAVFDVMTGQVSVEAVDLKYYTAWRNGTFYFYDTPLSEIVRQLGRWYDIQFVFTDDALRDVCFSGAALRSKPLDFILRLLESTKSVKFSSLENGTVTVSKK